MKRLTMLAVAGLSACVQAALETAPADFKWGDWQKMRPPASPEKRMELIQPVKAGELRLVPTYASCSVCWGSAPVEGLALEYRAAGAEWKKGETPIHFLDAANYRGSIFCLAEDTGYEMRLTAGGKTLASGSFRTWKSEVPVARTIMIDPATATYPIVVSEKGRPDGWIRYTTKPGAVLGGKDVMKSIFKVTDAKYVIFENMVLEGGGGNRDNPVFIENSTGVRVRNCEIYGFGRTGEKLFTAKGGGKPSYVDEKGRVHTFNWSAGIMIDPGSAEVTVERCYIHDARGSSNSWFYSHPSGTEGIFVNRVAHSIVLRWNDIVGSDLHRWNDAIGGATRDFDIYGNFCFNPTNDIPREWATKYPVRNLPFILDTGVIKGVQVTGPAATPAAVTFTAEASLEQPFRIRQNFDADWFTVSPAAGILKKGANRFTVTFIPGKMQDRRFWRSAFLVQTPEGLSRCVSIYAERMDFAPPVQPVPPGMTGAEKPKALEPR